MGQGIASGSTQNRYSFRAAQAWLVAAARTPAMLDAKKEVVAMAARRGSHQPGFNTPFRGARGWTPSSLDFGQL